MKVRAHAEDTLDAADHDRGSCSCQPVHVGPSCVRTCLAFRELPVAVRLYDTDLSPVILHGRRIFAEVGKCPVPAPHQGFRQDQPALGLGEHASVLLDTGIENDRQRPVKCMYMIRRIHKNSAVLRVQPLIDQIHGKFCLLRVRKSADHSPALRIQPHVSFRIRSLSDRLAFLRVSSDKAVAVPAELDQLPAECLLLLLQIFQIFGIFLLSCEFPKDRKCVIELEGDESRFAVLSEAKAVIPVRIKAGRHSVRPEMIQREIQSSLQVLIDTSLVAVRKRDHLIEERDISGLGDILVDRGEEPERVIRAVGRVPGRTDIAVVLRCILMSRIVVELDQRKSAAVMDLSRKHEPDLVSCFFRRQMNDALDILYRIAVTVAVPKTAVEEGGCSGPCKCHKAVICVPCVDHGVELRTGCFDLKVREPLTPHALQHFDFLLTDFFRRSVVLHDLPALLIILLSEDECNRSALPGLKTEDRRQSPDAVPVVSHTSSEISIDHTDRILYVW